MQTTFRPHKTLLNAVQVLAKLERRSINNTLVLLVEEGLRARGIHLPNGYDTTPDPQEPPCR